MKRLLLVFVTIVFTSCSFDNKTGIWKDASNTPASNQASRSITENEEPTRFEDVFVKTGDEVKGLDDIGTVAADSETGESTLHFELWINTSNQDPGPWLNH